ncbi:MAG: hypothetical protein PHN69_06100 [Candidatus Pacebacteria bacterium]|nr:hypothetical protein [Candidatus Paceibacterota bacterium]
MNAHTLTCPICRTEIFLQVEISGMGNLKCLCLGGHKFELVPKSITFKYETTEGENKIDSC